jgi:DNA-binding XRE family transcriptional regulator
MRRSFSANHQRHAVIDPISKHVPLPMIRGKVPIIGDSDSNALLPLLRGKMKKLPPNSSRISLAANLRAARSLFQWSQEELGLRSGLKRSYVGALERREVNPGIDNLDKLARGVGVLSHVLLLSPEVAYQDIYAAFELAPAPKA